jgi:hypothetical protein
MPIVEVAAAAISLLETAMQTRYSRPWRDTDALIQRAWSDLERGSVSEFEIADVRIVARQEVPSPVDVAPTAPRDARRCDEL